MKIAEISDIISGLECDVEDMSKITTSLTGLTKRIQKSLKSSPIDAREDLLTVFRAIDELERHTIIHIRHSFREAIAAIHDHRTVNKITD